MCCNRWGFDSLGRTRFKVCGTVPLVFSDNKDSGNLNVGLGWTTVVHGKASEYYNVLEVDSARNSFTFW